MASMGFLPFIFKTKSENSVLLNSPKTRRPRFPFFAYRPREPLDSAGNTSLSFGYWKAAGEDCAVLSLSCDRPIGGFCRGQQQGITPLKATSKGFVEGEDGGNEVEDALQATIEKSQKVLAMQKELLQQIAERRKLVSSIKNDVINQEDDEVSGRGNASANLDLLSDSDNTIDESTSSIFLTEDEEVPENLPSNSGGDFDEVKKESGKVVLLKKASSDPDSTKQLEEANTKEVLSDSLPSFLSSSSESSSEGDGNQEISTKTSLTEVDGEASDPVIEDIKPPPLAGANIMNVVLVAAECAPWSKTGGLGDVAGALPKALARRGHRVMVVAPRYGNYAEPQDIGVRKIYRVDRQDVEVRYFQAFIDGVDFVFIESPMFRHMENNIYGGNRMDVLKRMVLFCKAAVEVPWHVPCGGICYGDGNLVFIANDWHTALLPVYLKAYYRDHGLMKYTRSVLVIHNIAHQVSSYEVLFKKKRSEIMAPGTRNHPNREGSSESNQNDNPDHLVAAATQFFQSMVSGQFMAPRAPQAGCTLEQFARQHPPTFDGRLNALDAESWIDRMEQIFEVLYCTDDQKVKYATYHLTDMANKWWKATRALVQLELGEAVPISWEHFKKIFLDHFFPRTLQESRARQFMDLTQGSMTVAQYATTFMELSRFASYLIPDEEKKAEKFERGLDRRIRERVRTLRIRSFTELVTRATIAEEDLQENMEYNNQRKRQQQQQLPAVSHRDKRPHIMNRQGQPPAGQTYPTCATCGKRHLGKCMYGQSVCFKCGKPNHLARDCPIKKPGEPGRSGGQKTQATARVYTLTPIDAEASNDVVTGLKLRSIIQEETQRGEDDDYEQAGQE